MKHYYMRRTLRFSSIFVCILLLCSLYLSISAAAISNHTTCSVNTPYEYPLTPSSDQWLEMSSHADRVAACQIPENILTNMSTSALIETIVNYPLLVDVLLFNDAESAYQAISSGFNAIQELETRTDGFTKLTSFIDTCDEIQDDYIRKTALEVIALSAPFTSPVVSSPSYVASPLLNYTNAYMLYPDLSSSQSEFESILRIATPLTPSGYPITETWYYDRTPEVTPEQISLIEEEVLATYGLFPARDPTVKYNCHSYAWHDQSADNLYWINYPDDYLEDPRVSQVSSPQVNDRIVYQKSSSGRYQHSGIISIANDSVVMVRSKWGAWGLYNHTILNCPTDSYGTITSYYTID